MFKPCLVGLGLNRKRVGIGLTRPNPVVTRTNPPSPNPSFSYITSIQYVKTGTAWCRRCSPPCRRALRASSRRRTYLPLEEEEGHLSAAIPTNPCFIYLCFFASIGFTNKFGNGDIAFDIISISFDERNIPIASIASRIAWPVGFPINLNALIELRF